jgi:hypothetical protein
LGSQKITIQNLDPFSSPFSQLLCSRMIWWIVPVCSFVIPEVQKMMMYEYGKSSVGIIAWQDLILATCFPLYYIVMLAERPILLRFLNVLTSLNDFIIKRIVILFLVKYIASGTLIKSYQSRFNNHFQSIIPTEDFPYSYNLCNLNNTAPSIGTFAGCSD